MSCKLTITPGQNHWTVLVSDAVATTEAEATRELISAFATWFGVQLNPLTYFESDPDEYRIGEARPFIVAKVSRVREGENLIEALQGRAAPGPTPSLERRENVNGCDEVYTVRGTHPWMAWVSFYWRGPATTIDWPSWETQFIDEWRPGLDQDVLLWQAYYDSEAQSADDANWLEAQADDARQYAGQLAETAGEVAREAAEAAGEAAKAAAGVYTRVVLGVAAIAAGAGLVYFLVTRRSSR